LSKRGRIGLLISSRKKKLPTSLLCQSVKFLSSSSSKWLPKQQFGEKCVVFNAFLPLKVKVNC